MDLPRPWSAYLRIRRQMQRVKLTKRFFNHNSAIFLWTINDCGCDEISWAFGILSSDRDVVLLLVDVAEEGLDALVLHGILDRAKEDVFFEAFAHFQGLGMLNHRVTEWLEDLLMHKDSFESEADLGDGESGRFSSR